MKNFIQISKTLYLNFENVTFKLQKCYILSLKTLHPNFENVISELCFNRMTSEHEESFHQTSLAVSSLSLRDVKVTHVEVASKLIKAFFVNFVRLYREQLQTYNFHSLRHLCDQVTRVGPLWNCSAFAFESANHYLLRALSGTVKRPEKVPEEQVFYAGKD